eukprot:124898_1
MAQEEDSKAVPDSELRDEDDQNELLSLVQSNCTNLSNGIFKVTSILNHQVDPLFINLCSQKLYKNLIEANKLSNQDMTKIITVPASGLIPSFAMSCLLNIPMVYARHKVPITWSTDHSIYQAEYTSHTKNTKNKLFISGEYLNQNDKILIMDDVLATGQTMIALLDICLQAKAHVIAAGFVMEKAFENGRENIKKWCDTNNVKMFSIESAVAITKMEDKVGGKIEYQEL